MLDSENPTPLYYQLAQSLLAEIESGIYAVGEKIPSEPSLAKEHSIGRPTVRQATDWLIRRGYLERKRGSGTYVIQSAPPSLDLLSMAGTSRALEVAGVSDPVRLVEPVRGVRRHERMPIDITGDNFWFLKRLSSSDSVPLMLESFYLNANDYPDFEWNDLETFSLSNWVKTATGHLPTRTRQQFSIVTPDKEEQNLLNWTKDLILVRRTLYFEKQFQPIYCEMLCRTDQFEFSQTIGV